MSEYLDKLRRSTRQAEEDLLSQGRRPVCELKKQYLEQNGVTIEEYIEYVDPFCTVITHFALAPESLGVRSGMVIDSHYIVGHAEEQKELMWNIFAADEAMAESEHPISVVMVFRGIRPARMRMCAKTDGGATFSEHVY